MIEGLSAGTHEIGLASARERFYFGSMPRSRSNWDAFFNRRDAKTIARRKKRGETVKEPRAVPATSQWDGLIVPRVVGDAPQFDKARTPGNIQRFAREQKAKPTAAETRLADILSSLNGGALRERFVRQHIVSGKWIVDFFFPEVRLAIEVDGEVHDRADQRERDRQKDRDCERFDITVLRIPNEWVFGDREELIARLRTGWLEAKNRKNALIGHREPLSR